MLIYRIVSEDSPGRYYPGQTEASKVAREQSKASGLVLVYEFSSPKVAMNKSTVLAALNEEAWCEPRLVAQFENGRTKKSEKT
jgi:hypothetical protein